MQLTSSQPGLGISVSDRLVGYEWGLGRFSLKNLGIRVLWIELFSYSNTDTVSKVLLTSGLVGTGGVGVRSTTEMFSASCVTCEGSSDGGSLPLFCCRDARHSATTVKQNK